MPAPRFRPRVLVADADPPALRRMVRILGELGADVIPAPDGRQALALLGSMQPLPDLIITEVRLRDVGGEPLLRGVWASERLAPIPVVAVTGTGTELPFDLVLAKPCGKGDLRTALRLERRVARGRDPATKRRSLRARPG
jgi:CheY-like chemotaxis protein